MCSQIEYVILMHVIFDKAIGYLVGVRPFFHPLRYLWYGLEVSFQRRQLRITRQIAVKPQHWQKAEHMNSLYIRPHHLKSQTVLARWTPKPRSQTFKGNIVWESNWKKVASERTLDVLNTVPQFPADCLWNFLLIAFEISCWLLLKFPTDCFWNFLLIAFEISCRLSLKFPADCIWNFLLIGCCMSGLVHVHTYLVIDEKSVFVDEFLQIHQHRWKFFHSFLSRRILTQ